MQVSKKLKLGIVGSPLVHSKSPQMQAAGLEYLGIDGEYKKYEINPEHFQIKFPALLKEVDGLNITIPFKEEAMKFVDELDPLAEKIGAINTVHVVNGKVIGYNTDYYGFLEPIRSLNLESKKAALLGAGGASRAVLLALDSLGVKEIEIYARNIPKAIKSFSDMQKDLVNAELSFKNFDLLNRIEHAKEVRLLSGTSILINSTPFGQGELAGRTPICDPALSLMPINGVVYDLIYEETALLQAASGMGLTSMDGSMMLVLQGAKALSIWTGKSVSEELVEAMRQGLRN